MKKGIILSALSLCLVALSGKAQSSLVVTLADSSGLQVYYGSEAFRNAVSDATLGGVITLSSGFFSAADIVSL